PPPSPLPPTSTSSQTTSPTPASSTPSPQTVATKWQPEPPRSAETPRIHDPAKMRNFQGKRERPRSSAPPFNPKAAGSNPARPIAKSLLNGTFQPGQQPRRSCEGTGGVRKGSGLKP